MTAVASPHSDFFPGGLTAISPFARTVSLPSPTISTWLRSSVPETKLISLSSNVMAYRPSGSIWLLSTLLSTTSTPGPPVFAPKASRSSMLSTLMATMSNPATKGWNIGRLIQSSSAFPTVTMPKAPFLLVAEAPLRSCTVRSCRPPAMESRQVSNSSSSSSTTGILPLVSSSSFSTRICSRASRPLSLVALSRPFCTIWRLFSSFLVSSRASR
mmetsp:Transcript_4924/g.17272  ORF Transcript_4924/g.17272 Transcript_4924/m.17272 type:complete len:214 (+) Transcript_4924:1233-1874(+)